MIVGMTKYSFLVYHKEYDDFLKQLRELGLVHVCERIANAREKENDPQKKLQKIKEVELSISELEKETDLQTKLQQAKKAEQTILEMKRILGEDLPTNDTANGNEGADFIGKFDSFQNEKAHSEQKRVQIAKEIEQLQIWGDFDWKKISALCDAGYKIQFHAVSSSKYNSEWEAKFNAFVISTVGSQTYFITVTTVGTTVEMENTELVRLPQKSLSSLFNEKDLEATKFVNIETEIKELCQKAFNEIETYYRLMIDDINYTKVVINTEHEADDKIRLLEGWIPTDKEQRMNQVLDSEGIYYVSKRATRTDNAPIMLRNNKFAKLFHPITELYEMPAYGALDLTPFFAPFFVMFFGLCLGDAGYGVLLLLAGLIARKKVSSKMKPLMTLVSILGAGTLVFGFMSGTLFGIELLKVDWPWIQKFKAIMLNSDQLFTFSLIIGGVQIIFGMFIKAISQTIRFGFKNALATWGWIFAIVGCGGTFGLQNFGFIGEGLAKILYITMGTLAVLGIFIFNDIKRNPLINIGAGLWDSYNMATGLLGDVLSYVRLFALGISGAVLGLVFNDLAMKMSPDIPVVGFLVSAIILLFGHAMNIFMSGLGAFVHPLRLTFVEFYKNAGFEGGGTKYSPFHRARKE